MKPFAYCAAIRTLGRAGHKYLRLLQSLQAQTQPPLKILVYLADDCPPPPETLGCETLVRVPRGMVAQRALPYDEVTTPYLLLLDDDLYLPPRTVEMLAEAIQQHDGDAVAVDVFRNHELPWPLKVRSALTNWALPRPNDGWAFKLLANGSFTYNNHPPQGACPSQTAAGAASLWRTDVLRALHLDHECWLDRRGFAYGEDLLHFRKLTLNGGRLLVHDAGEAAQHAGAADALMQTPVWEQVRADWIDREVSLDEENRLFTVAHSSEGLPDAAARLFEAELRLVALGRFLSGLAED